MESQPYYPKLSKFNIYVPEYSTVYIAHTRAIATDDLSLTRLDEFKVHMVLRARSRYDHQQILR